MRFEVNDLKAIGEALEGIVEKLQEQFAPVAFDITLEYPGLEVGGPPLIIQMTSIPNQSWRFAVDITEKQQGWSGGEPVIKDDEPQSLQEADQADHTWDDHRDGKTEVMHAWPAREETP